MDEQSPSTKSVIDVPDQTRPRPPASAQLELADVEVSRRAEEELGVLRTRPFVEEHRAVRRM